MVYLSKRFTLAVMLFMICLTNYMARVNLSMNMFAMVLLSNSSQTLPDYGPRYNWSQSTQEWLSGAYFYGYLVTSLPGGTLAEMYGGKPIIFWSTLLTALLTALSAFAALNEISLLIIRVVLGLLGGVVFPSCHNLISKWAPPDEKGKFIASLMGGTFGMVITWPISVILIEFYGWSWAFYLIGILILFVALAWWWLVEDSPALHPSISDEERDYILTSLGSKVNPQKHIPPYKAIFMSAPFWALLVLHYGSMWGLYSLIMETPTFLSEVLGFKLSKIGIPSSLPYLARLIFAFVFGEIADRIRHNEWLTVTATRKVFCITSHIIPGAMLFILAFFGKDPYMCVAIITISLGSNGSAACTNLANAQDLAPNFAGTLYGVVNFFGTAPSFICPLIVGLLTEEGNTMDQWKYIFLIGGSLYVIPALLFFVVGSGETQPWNEPDSEK